VEILHSDDVGQLEDYLAQGGDIDEELCVLMGWPAMLDRHPPLVSAACFFAAERCFNFLRLNAASLSLTDRNGRAPVHFASAGGSLAICDTLDTSGCDFTVLDSGAAGCLHYACQFGRTDLVRRFEARNFPLDAPDSKGRRPVHYAALAPTAEVIAFLHERGCDVEAVSADGLTPFTCAFAVRALDVIRYLISCHVKTNVFIEQDRNALQQAAFTGDAPLVEVLLENEDEDIDRGDLKLGWTALHWAAQEGRMAVCRLLVEKGADVNKTTKHNFSPRHAAANNGHLDIDKYLEQNGAKYHPGDDD
jgi:ankyrin repeat protein